MVLRVIARTMSWTVQSCVLTRPFLPESAQRARVMNVSDCSTLPNGSDRRIQATAHGVCAHGLHITLWYSL